MWLVDAVDGVERGSAYQAAVTDWLACACAGARERAAQAMRAAGDGLLGDVAFAATAGHVLDFDDTFSPGVAHVTATTAPAALVLAAHLELSLQAALAAYAVGYEAMAAVAAASHPALYDRGWHPTAVCGPIGAALAAAALLELSPGQCETALSLAVLRAGGTRGAFGSDAKAIQVGLAAAAGVQAARLAAGGASVDSRAVHGPLGFEAVLGAVWPRVGGAGMGPGNAHRAIEHNWIKLYPSCLGTHAPIEAAALARRGGYRLQRDQVEVLVHPVARQAAHLDKVSDGLGAKFSIPYCVAHTLAHGPPRVHDFVAVDGATLELSTHIRVTLDASLPEFGAALTVGGHELARVTSPSGAPGQPAAARALAGKITELAGDRLCGVFDDLGAPAAAALRAAGLGRS